MTRYVMRDLMFDSSSMLNDESRHSVFELSRALNLTPTDQLDDLDTVLEQSKNVFSSRDRVKSHGKSDSCRDSNVQYEDDYNRPRCRCPHLNRRLDGGAVDLVVGLFAEVPNCEQSWSEITD